jgi:hypothetical protein
VVVGQVHDTRRFVVGLADWVEVVPPTAAVLAGTRLVDLGYAHVLTIRETGGAVLGVRDPELDSDPGLMRVSHRAGGTVQLMRNAVVVRAATAQEARELPELGAWGLTFIRARAERLVA